MIKLCLLIAAEKCRFYFVDGLHVHGRIAKGYEWQLAPLFKSPKLHQHPITNCNIAELEAHAEVFFVRCMQEIEAALEEALD